MIEERGAGRLFGGSEMPACRLCSANYPREYFIHGVGPRKDVCVRCGVKHGMVEESEVPVLFDERTSMARLSLRARRYGAFLWIGILWGVWFSVLGDIAVWGLVSAIVLGLLTLILPIRFLLGSAAYQASLARLTPNYARPPGH